MNLKNENIRFATPEDADDIARVHVASWQKIYRGHIPDKILDHLSIEQRSRQWAELLMQNVKVLLIENNEHIIGFASICPARDQDFFSTEYGEISALYLHPDYWHHGFGTVLCDAALMELEKEHFEKVIVWVLKENRQARSFYEARGFTDTGKIKIESYADHVLLNEVCYQKDL